MGGGVVEHRQQIRCRLIGEAVHTKRCTFKEGGKWKGSASLQWVIERRSQGADAEGSQSMAHGRMVFAVTLWWAMHEEKWGWPAWGRRSPSNRKYQILSQLDDPSFIPPCVCMWIDGGASLVFLKGSSRKNYTKYDASTVNVVISRADIADAINIRCAQSILFCVCAIRKQVPAASCPWRLSRKTKSIAHKHQHAELIYVLFCFCSFALSKLKNPANITQFNCFLQHSLTSCRFNAHAQ